MAGRVVLKKNQIKWCNDGWCELTDPKLKKARKQKYDLISIHHDDEVHPLTPSQKSPHTHTSGEHILFVDRVNP